MSVYWAALVVLIMFTMFERIPRRVESRRAAFDIRWAAFAAFLILLIGLRHEVGGDWSIYEEYVWQARQEQLLESLTISSDPAYALLNWIGANWGGGIYLINTVCAVLFVLGVTSFCRSLPNAWLAMLAAYPYLIVVVAMGYTRQGVAIGLVMAAIPVLQQRRMRKFAALVLLAAAFHKSALIILLPALLSEQGRRAWIRVAMIAMAAAVLFVVLVSAYLDTLVATYLDAEYDSSGAGVRVAMSVLAGVLYLWLLRRESTIALGRFWQAMSWLALLLPVLLAISPSSTAVDRLALYWVPLQLVVMAHLPQTLGYRAVTVQAGRLLIASYCTALLAVWLLFAHHASAWIPYQMAPFI